MKRPNKKIMLILSIFLIFLVMGAASATDNDSVSQDDEVLAVEDAASEEVVSTDTTDENTDVLADDNTAGSFSELEQYINDNKGYKKTVTLTKDYTFNNETDLKINVTGIYLGTYVEIDGQDHTIDAKNTKCIFNSIGKYITLKNIVFKNTNWRAIEVGSSDVSIINCTFDNCTDRSVGLSTSALNCVIDECTFINGAGLYSSATGAVIRNSLFKNNTATNGGAINVNSNNSYINNCSFIDNNAENGGAIYFSFTLPDDVYNTNAVLYINGSKFKGNKANTGGAIDNHRSVSPNLDQNENGYLIEGNKIIISESIFGDNYAVNNPQIFGNYTSDNTIKQGIFLEPLSELFVNLKDNDIINIEQDYTLSSGPILITANNITINGNNHIIDANAFSAIDFRPSQNFGKIMINNLTIKNSNGSALYLSSGHTSASINNCIFINNTASNGGAINIYSARYGDGSSFTINNCSFVNNSAINGGAIYVSPSSVLSISYSNFTFNNAICGGAIYSSFGGWRLVFDHCQYINNSATSYGCIYFSNNELDSSRSYTNSKFINNTALSISYGVPEGYWVLKNGKNVYENNFIVPTEFSEFFNTTNTTIMIPHGNYSSQTIVLSNQLIIDGNGSRVNANGSCLFNVQKIMA